MRGDAPPAAPEIADVVAVPVVPFRPSTREAPGLVGIRPVHIPRFGDQLDPVDHRVLVDQVEERRQPVERAAVPRQRGGQVETEPVDVHLGHPVAQRVHDQPQHLPPVDVQRVPGAGAVDVPGGVVRIQSVVLLVGQAAERDRRLTGLALGGVVVDHVQDHFQPGPVQRLDHFLELDDLTGRDAAGPVAGVRREEAESRVAPIVRQTEVEQPLLGQRTGGPATARPRSRPTRAGDRAPPDWPGPERCRAGAGSTPGCRRLMPLTWVSYRTVCDHGVSGGRSYPQSNQGSTTSDCAARGAASSIACA